MSNADAILAAVRAAGPAGTTSKDIKASVGFDAQGVTNRLAELYQRGLIRDSGQRRRVGIRGKLIVWVAVPADEIQEATPTAPPKVKRRVSPSRPQDFWADIRQRILAHATATTDTSIDAGVLHVLYRDFEAEMRELVERFGVKISRARAPVEVVVSRRRLLEACRLLSVPPPSVNQPADLTAAKRGKRSMVRVYHPDVATGNTDDMRAMLDAAIAAYDTIEAYNDSLTRKVTP